MIYKAIFLCIGLSFSTISNAYIIEVDYSYIGNSKYERVLIGESLRSQETVILAGRDHILAIDMCDEESGFFCFFSIRYAFSVPRTLTNQKKWTVKNVEFKIVKNNISYSILGKKYIDLYLIQTPASATLVGKATGKSMFWLYSKEFGLLGFSQKEDEVTYYLQQAKGFGHN